MAQVGHDVGGDAARAAAHEQKSDGDLVREPEQMHEPEGEERHDRVLSDRADEDVERASREDHEIIRGECEAHSEHDDSEDDCLAGAFDLGEQTGEEVGDDGDGGDNALAPKITFIHKGQVGTL